MDQHDRNCIDQFTQQATHFREFAQMPGRARELVFAATETCAADTVLDVACGPGVTTCDLAEVACHATGIDITPAMIDQAKQLQQSRGLTNITWQVASVPPLPFADQAFSIVFTRYSFHHFRDPAAVLQEMVRVCATGGRIVVVDVFMTTQQQADAYNALEKLRDPSHVRALLLTELKDLFAAARLHDANTLFYRQEMAVERLLKGSFPNPGDEERIRQAFNDDLGRNVLGLDAQWRDGDIQFSYPIVAFVGFKR